MKELSLMPIGQEWTQLKEICLIAHQSGLLPSSIKSVQQAIVIALKGRELKIPPMVAFAQIAVINGKPAMSAELMLATIYREFPKAVINQIQCDDSGCVIDVKRTPDAKFSTFSFTKDDAVKAGLLGKQVWKQYPHAMYRARCISAMARFMFPDAINGISYTPEELGADGIINDDGEFEMRDVTPNNNKQKENGGPSREKHKNEMASHSETSEAPPQSPPPPPTPSPSSEAPPENKQKILITDAMVNGYKLPFGGRSFRQGATFDDLGKANVAELLKLIQIQVLKSPTPDEKFTTFIEMAKHYLARFE